MSTDGKGFFGRLRAKLNRGGTTLAREIRSLLQGRQIDAALLEELEERLIGADVGVQASTEIVADLKGRVGRHELADADALLDALRARLTEILRPSEGALRIEPGVRPFVVLVVGVNGSGKTTTIGKLAARLRGQGLKVMLAAGDTFRAAAIEQLGVWAERSGAQLIAQPSGADPGAVVFDALQAARARGIDVLLADTAGRLHSQAQLMAELGKIKRVLGRIDPTAPGRAVPRRDRCERPRDHQARRQRARRHRGGHRAQAGPADPLHRCGRIQRGLRPFRCRRLRGGAARRQRRGAARGGIGGMITFQSVAKRYRNGREALTNVSLHVAPGEMVFLTGRSGAGKSTVLKLIALLERPTRGQVVVSGEGTARLPARRVPAFRRRVGVVFQDHRLLVDRPVFDNVALPLIVADSSLKEIGKRVRAALDQVGLLGSERVLPSELSVGPMSPPAISIRSWPPK